ncbi:hypothetical protein QLQ15_13195 [Lysobacter sp. LF1]|uniref:Methyltransferase n=1 Tax=Lysobacter stagni TaxID=3045172 RepID=A0ABT6XI74_9GAMM|nr:hypothetical protein [Lysobacter sp. LF1]MDI9239861.1 hypothetical protein [Lysobacter sp. LF1]
MNRTNAQSIALRARSLRARVAAVTAALTASLFSVAAWAQDSDVGAAITAEVQNAKTTVGGILMILAGIVGVLLLWAYVKRAK